MLDDVVKLIGSKIQANPERFCNAIAFHWNLSYQDIFYMADGDRAVDAGKFWFGTFYFTVDEAAEFNPTLVAKSLKKLGIDALSSNQHHGTPRESSVLVFKTQPRSTLGIQHQEATRFVSKQYLFTGTLGFSGDFAHDIQEELTYQHTAKAIEILSGRKAHADSVPKHRGKWVHPHYFLGPLGREFSTKPARVTR